MPKVFENITIPELKISGKKYTSIIEARSIKTINNIFCLKFKKIISNNKVIGKLRIPALEVLKYSPAIKIRIIKKFNKIFFLK
jgi:hypothetical protein